MNAASRGKGKGRKRGGNAGGELRRPGGGKRTLARTEVASVERVQSIAEARVFPRRRDPAPASVEEISTLTANLSLTPEQLAESLGLGKLKEHKDVPSNGKGKDSVVVGESRRYFEDAETSIDETTLESKLEELTKIVAMAEAAAKCAANLQSTKFLDGTDLSSLKEDEFRSLANRRRIRRTTPLPEQEPELPPLPEPPAKVVSGAWLREHHRNSMPQERRADHVRVRGGGGGSVSAGRTTYRSSYSAGQMIKEMSSRGPAQTQEDADAEIDSIVREIQSRHKLSGLRKVLTDELGRVPTRAELAFRAGLPSEHALQLLVRTYRENDQKFVEKMMPIVLDVSKRYNQAKFRGGDVEQADLVTSGLRGARRCAEKWKFDKGYNFNFYVQFWMRQSMSKTVNERTKEEEVPAHIHQQLGKLRKSTQMLKKRLGRPPTTAELATVMNMTERRVAKIQEANVFSVGAETQSFAQGGAHDDFRTMAETTPDDSMGEVMETCVNEMIEEDVDSLLKTLAPREYDVLKRRYAVKEDESLTLEEIGSSLQVTRERVRQIEAKALRKLRHQSQHSGIIDSLTHEGI